MDLERDQSLRHTLYTLSELNSTFLPTVGPRKPTCLPTLDVQEAGRQQQARFAPFKAKNW